MSQRIHPVFRERDDALEAAGLFQKVPSAGNAAYLAAEAQGKVAVKTSLGERKYFTPGARYVVTPSNQQGTGHNVNKG